MIICICHNVYLYLYLLKLFLVFFTMFIFVRYKSQRLFVFVTTNLFFFQHSSSNQSVIVTITASYLYIYYLHISHFQLCTYCNVQYFLGHSSIYKGEEHIIPGLWALFNILNRWRCIQAPIPLYPTKLSLFLCIKSNLAPDFSMRWPMH